MELTFKNNASGYAQATFKDLAKTFEVVLNQPATAITLPKEKGHFCESVHTNMVTVWHILYGEFGQIPAWIHAAPTKKEKNGCKLLHLLLLDH
jgi:hypothetical protein